MAWLIQFGGIYCLILALFHLSFRTIFRWNVDLRTLSSLNRAVVPVLNLSLTFVFFIFAWLSLVHTDELLDTPLGHALLALISLFWLFRAMQQIIFFGLSHWLSWAFLFYFLGGALIYATPLLMLSTG